MTKKVIATENAMKVIEMLKEKHGNILFQQSSGCCDGTSPMCYEADGFYLGSQNVLIGEVAGVPYYLEKSKLEYFKYTQLEIDVIEGTAAAYSLESAHGYGFILNNIPLSRDEQPLA